MFGLGKTSISSSMRGLVDVFDDADAGLRTHLLKEDVASAKAIGACLAGSEFYQRWGRRR
jgi:hypothetical protein